MENSRQKAIKEIAAQLQLLQTSEESAGYDALQEKINDLINNDFSALVQLLYRLDVAEERLKSVLKNSAGTDAAKIITDLIIERQLQKIKTRRHFRQRDNNINENEKW